MPSAGLRTKVVGPPLTASVTTPLFEQDNANAVAPAVTGSENVTDRSAVTGKLFAPSAGNVAVTFGAASDALHVDVYEPRPEKVSVASPSHSAAGSNPSLPLASPAQVAGFRVRVLSAVLARPVPHSVPGLLPSSL